MMSPETFGEQLGALVKAAIAREAEVIRQSFAAEVHRLELELATLKAKPQPVAPGPVLPKSASILSDGTLSIEWDNGLTLNAGIVKGDKGDKGDPGHDAKGEKGDKGDPGQDGADGAGIADALIDRDGHLTLTFTDGRTKALGVIVGKDGTDGNDGKPGEDGSDGKDGRGVEDASIDRDGKLRFTFSDGHIKSLGVVIGEPGKDGEDGKPGADGLNLEDLDIELVDERTIKVFARRDGLAVEKFLTIPVQIYRGVYQPGSQYEIGDTVTFGGSMWTVRKSEGESLQTEPGKPGEDPAWQLCVKKGRDGRDFEVRDDKKGGIKL